MVCVCNNRLAFALGAGLATTGGLLFFLLGHTYIPPYLHEGNFEGVTCRVIASQSSGNFCCDATYRGMSACASVVPCYQITVNYNIPGGNGANQSAIAYQNYRAYTFQVPSNNCSWYNCPATFAEAKVEGDLLMATYGVVGSSYGCWRNPAIPTEVQLSNTPISTVVLCTLLPAISLIIGSILCSLGYKGKFPACPAEWEEEEDDDDDEKGLFEKVSNGGKSSADLHKGVENGEVAQTDEGATDDTHVECMSLSGSKSNLKFKGGATGGDIPAPPAYNSVA